MMDEVQFNKKIGKNIQQIRKSYGYTQEELALSLNISSQVMQSMEAGRTKPTLYRVCKILSFFKDHSFNDLIYGIGDMVPHRLNRIDNPEIFYFIEKAMELSETEDGKKILRSIKYLLN